MSKEKINEKINRNTDKDEFNKVLGLVSKKLWKIKIFQNNATSACIEFAV